MGGGAAAGTDGFCVTAGTARLRARGRGFPDCVLHWDGFSHSDLGNLVETVTVLLPFFPSLSDVHGQPLFVGRAASVAGQRRVRWPATKQKEAT